MWMKNFFEQIDLHISCWIFFNWSFTYLSHFKHLFLLLLIHLSMFGTRFSIVSLSVTVWINVVPVLFYLDLAFNNQLWYLRLRIMGTRYVVFLFLFILKSWRFLFIHLRRSSFPVLSLQVKILIYGLV